MKKTLGLLLFGLLFSVGACAADITEGKHYKVIEAQPTESVDKIEVLEFFWYGCPHCYSFEPFLQKWKVTKPDNVEFVRVPAIFRPSWKLHARAYYALEEMDKLDEAHQQIFEAIHKKRQKLNSMAQIADLVAQHGVDREAFIKQYRSFTVDGKVRKANKLVKDYKVQGVPMVVVDGKYSTDGRMAGSYAKMIEVIDYLVAKESK